MSNDRALRNKRKMKKSKSNYTLLYTGAAVVALLIVYVLFGLYFNNHFYIRSTVNGVNTSFKSAESAYEAIMNSANNYELVLVHNDGSVEASLSADELGVSVNYKEDEVAKLLERQNGFRWIDRMFAGEEYNTGKGNTYDAQKVEEVALKLSSLEKSDGEESANAYIAFDGKEFVIEPEVIGTNITHESIVNALVNAIENFNSEINIDNGECFARPEICSDSKDLEAALEQINKYMDTDITYDLGEGITETIPADEKAKWFKVDEKCDVDFNQDAIGEFVNSMGDKYNTYGKRHHLVTTSGEEVDVPAGSFGWKIAYQGEIDAIIADLEGGQDVTRDFTYLYKAASHGENDYGGNYVEVNLTEQHVYLYKDGEMVFDTDCVTGNISASHGTHTGAYPIAYKEKDATLRGANYESHVKYWMPFNMGEGLHDASWRSSFGGKIFQTSGSHGCVNLPTSSAKTIFETVEAGWPVLLYYTGDSEAEIYAANNPVNRVMTEIAEIETVTLDSAVALINARTDYDALSDEEKAQVTNIDVLEAAELQYQVLLMQSGNQQQVEQPITQE